MVEAAALPDIHTYASTTAQSFGLNPVLFAKVISCESNWNIDAIGDKGTSFGLAQLHNPETDWGISTTTALDPYASINIMAQAWSENKQERWSCYRELK